MINKEDLETWCNKYNLTLISEVDDKFLIPLSDIVKHTKYKNVQTISDKFSKDKLFSRMVSIKGINNANSKVKKLCVDLQDAVDVISKHGAGTNESLYKEIVDIYNRVPVFKTTSTVNIKKKALNELCDKFKIQ